MMSVTSITSNDQRTNSSSSHFTGRVLVDYNNGSDVTKSRSREVQSSRDDDGVTYDNGSGSKRKPLPSYSSHKNKLNSPESDQLGSFEKTKNPHLTSCSKNPDDDEMQNYAVHKHRHILQNEIITLGDEKYPENLATSRRENNYINPSEKLPALKESSSPKNQSSSPLSVAKSPSTTSLIQNNNNQNNVTNIHKVLVGKRLSLQSTEFDAAASTKSGNLKRMSAPNFTTIHSSRSERQSAEKNAPPGESLEVVTGEDNNEFETATAAVSVHKFKRSSVHIIPHKKRTKFELVNETDESTLDFNAQNPHIIENSVLEDGEEEKTSSREQLEFEPTFPVISNTNNGLDSQVLMRTMTEILTNQLRLTRQIETINDHFYTFNSRFRGIESKIFELGGRIDKSSPREKVVGSDTLRKSTETMGEPRTASRVSSSPFETTGSQRKSTPPPLAPPPPPPPPQPQATTSQVFLSTTSPSSYKSIISADRQPIMKQSNSFAKLQQQSTTNFDHHHNNAGSLGGEQDGNNLIQAIAAAAAVAAHQNMNKMENLQSQIPLAKCNSAPMESHPNNQINNSTSYDIPNKQRLVPSMSLKPNYFSGSSSSAAALGGSNNNQNSLHFNNSQHHYNSSNKQHFSSSLQQSLAPSAAAAQNSPLFQPYQTNPTLSLHSSHPNNSNPLRNFDSSNHQFPLLAQQQAQLTQHIQSFMPSNQTTNLDSYLSQTTNQQHFASQSGSAKQQYDHHSIHSNQASSRAAATAAAAASANSTTASSMNSAALAAAAAAVAAAMAANNNASNSTNSSNSISSKNQSSQASAANAAFQASTGSILNAVAAAAAASQQDSMNLSTDNKTRPLQYDQNYAAENRIKNESESSVGSQVSEELDNRSKHFAHQPVAKQSSSSASIPNSAVSYTSLISQRHIPSSLVDQLELSQEVERLVSRDVIKRCIRKAKHRGNFAANLAAELFSKEERIMGNCTGTRGKRQLSPRRLQIVKEITFRMYTNQAIQQVTLKCGQNGENNLAAATTAILQEFEEAWRKECITAIDAKNRSIGRDLIRTSSSSNATPGGNGAFSSSNLSSSANQNGYQDGYYDNNNDDYEDDYTEDIDQDEDTYNNQNNSSINNDDQISEENNHDNNVTSNEEEEEESNENSESQKPVVDVESSLE